MSNQETWALKQINSLDIPQERKSQYETVLKAFDNQGHSGFSAGYALSFINKYIDQDYEIVKNQLDKMLQNSAPEEDGFNPQQEITKDILEIIDLFREFGFGKDEAHKVQRLMDWKPIVPLTGAEDEWNDVSIYDSNESPTQQNKVCSAVFRKNFDNSTAHYLYGRVYSDNGGHTWFTGNHKNGVVQSSIPVKFPYWVPDKSEYVYLNGEDSEEIITDKARIKELYDEWEKARESEFEVFSFKEVINQLKDGDSYISINGKDIETKISKVKGMVKIDMYKDGEPYKQEIEGLDIRDCVRYKKIS